MRGMGMRGMGMRGMGMRGSIYEYGGEYVYRMV